MKVKITLFFMASLLLVLSACGNSPDYGMNEITFEEMITMFDDRDSFLLLTHDMDEEYLDEWKVIESFDHSLNRADLKGFYVSLQGMSKEEVLSLEEKYISPRSGAWNPERDGLVLVENGAVVTERTASVSEREIERWVYNEWIQPESELREDWFDDDIGEIIQVIQLLNVELTYQ